MGIEIIAAFIGAGATLIIGVPTIFLMRKSHKLKVQEIQEQKRKAEREATYYKQLVDEAPKRFSRSLGHLIEQASEESSKESPNTNLIPAARALVSARNGFKSVLESVGERLNSEISDLEGILSSDNPNQEEVAMLVETLKRKWPAKREEIELAVRKVLTELGIVLDPRQ